MIKFTTSSGAVYLVDDENRRYKRESGPFSPGIAPGYDGTWVEFEQRTEVVPAAHVWFFLPGGLFSRTTPVEEVEDVD